MKKYFPYELTSGDSIDYQGERFIVISVRFSPHSGQWEAIVTNRLMGGARSIWLDATEQLVDEHYDEVTKGMPA